MKHNNSLFSDRGAFTLIEVLIVIAISAMLAAMAVVYSSVGRNAIALSSETAKISEFIYQAKELAASTYVTSQSCGYGVYFDYARNKYSIFTYEPQGSPPCPDSALALNSVPSFPNNQMAQYSDATWNVPIKTGVKFNGNGSALVLFYPPDPTTRISADGSSWSDNNPLNIELVTADGTASSTITVNAAGEITTD